MSVIRGGLIIEGVQPDALRFHGAVATAVNEVQTATQSGTWTSGTFTVSILGQTTAPIAYNATGANVATALNLLNVVGASGFGGSGASGGPFVLTASGGNVSGKDIPLMVYNTAGIVGGGTIANVETTKGVTATGYGAAQGQIMVRDDTGIAYTNQGTATSPNLVAV
jgi:hypothetical protein